MDYLVLAALLFFGVVFVPMLIWAIVTRQPWWQLKNAIYYALCGIVLTFGWIFFVSETRPDLVGGIGSLFVVAFLSYLAKEHFNQ